MANAIAYTALVALVLTSALLGINIVVGNTQWTIVFAVLTLGNTASVASAINRV